MPVAKFASLHPGLLARKGRAMPAARPEEAGRDAMTEHHFPARNEAIRVERAANETPTPSKDCRVGRKMAEMPPGGQRLSVSLGTRQQRLLRLVAAATDRSPDKILGLALDAYLPRLIAEELGDCRCLSRLILADRQSPKKPAE